MTRRNAFNGWGTRRPPHKCKPYAKNTPGRPSVSVPAETYALLAVYAAEHGLTNKAALDVVMEGL